MRLKYRFPLFFSVTISILLAVVMMVIYYLFADFRKTEFRSRLYEKAETAGRLFIEVKEVDSLLLAIIDKNSAGKMRREAVRIYDDGMNLLYSSGDSTIAPFSFDELKKVKKTGQVFWNKDVDVFGLHYPFSNKDYYIFIAAQDKYGIRKLNYLKFLLVCSYLASIALIWLVSFHLSRITLRTLLNVTQQIKDSNTHSRKINIGELKYEDEIKALATSFNLLMDRIQEAYASQQEFTSNAAHELRTPLARITSQLENLLKSGSASPAMEKDLTGILQEAYQLSDIITSLLLLSKIEADPVAKDFRNVRIDEILFGARAQLTRTFPDFKFHFTIENTTADETKMEVSGDETLLGVAFLNILRNAYSYSDNQSVVCQLKQSEGRLEVRIVNSGDTPEIKDTRQLFATFKRGSNAKNKSGSGIGLSIVQRILRYHRASLAYQIPDKRTNEILISFAQ